MVAEKVSPRSRSSLSPEHYNDVRILSGLPVKVEIEVRTRWARRGKSLQCLGEIPGTDLKAR